MTIGSQVSNVRKQKGMTQEELAERAQITVRTIQRVESGKSLPRAYTLKLIAAALELPYEQFANPLLEPSKLNLVAEITDTVPEDRHFLEMVCLASFTFIVIPYVHFLIPRFIIKKTSGISTHAKLMAEKLVNIQIWWVVVLHLGLLIMLVYNITQARYGNKQFRDGYLWLVLFMYIFNAVFIISTRVKCRHFTRQKVF